MSPSSVTLHRSFLPEDLAPLTTVGNLVRALVLHRTLRRAELWSCSHSVAYAWTTAPTSLAVKVRAFTGIESRAYSRCSPRVSGSRDVFPSGLEGRVVPRPPTPLRIGLRHANRRQQAPTARACGRDHRQGVRRQPRLCRCELRLPNRSGIQDWQRLCSWVYT